MSKLKKEVKLYGGLDNKTKSPTGYGDELATTPDQAMSGTVIAEDEGGVTTADMAAYDTRVGTMSKNNQKPQYGYSYMPNKSGLDEGIQKGYEPENIARIKARPDYKDMQNDLRTICREYSLIQTPGFSLKDQIAQRNPVYQKEIATAFKEFCAKYNLTGKTLGLESYDYAGEERDYYDKQNLKSEDIDYAAAEENNYFNKIDYGQLRKDIVDAFHLMIDSNIDTDTAIGSVAEKFKQDPEYVKALVESQTKTLNKEVMTEKENKIKKLLESYGIVTKSKAPIAEEDDEDSEKDEDGEKEEPKSEGPKKGVNPFAKKKDKKDSEDDSEEGSEEKKGKNPFAKKDDEDSDDETSEEDETEEEEHKFTGAGSEVSFKGIDREIAKGLAVKLLAPINDLVAPKGKYTITFEPTEEEGVEGIEPEEEMEEGFMEGKKKK